MVWRALGLHAFGLLVSVKGKVKCYSGWSPLFLDEISDHNGLFQDAAASIHRAQGVSECFTSMNMM